MKAPQIIMIILTVADLVYGLMMDGKQTIKKHDFGVTLFTNAIFCALLYWGGFWK